MRCSSRPAAAVCGAREAEPPARSVCACLVCLPRREPDRTLSPACVSSAVMKGSTRGLVRQCNPIRPDAGRTAGKFASAACR